MCMCVPALGNGVVVYVGLGVEAKVKGTGGERRKRKETPPLAAYQKRKTAGEIIIDRSCDY